MSRIYRARTISAFFAALIFLIVLLLCPTYCVQGIKNGLEYASGIIIPSLFPYIVLSGFIMRSGADIIIGKLFSPVMKKFFYLPEVCAPCVIMSFIGGFPVGAKCTSLLYRQGRITARQARQLMDFCVCSGPAFLISAVGAVMLGNKSAGIILYISQIISGLIIGILVGIISRIKTAQDSQNTVISSSANSSGILSEILGSVSDGADSVIGMTSLILLFSMLESVIRNTGAYELMARLLSVSVADDRYAFIILPSLLEVTGGCCAVKDASLPLWCFALCTGFGGLSECYVSIPNIFKGALLCNAAGIILAHNHVSSGLADPSEEDVEFTRRVCQAGQILGIRVHDHLILGCDGQYYSFAEDHRISKFENDFLYKEVV